MNGQQNYWSKPTGCQRMIIYPRVKLVTLRGTGTICILV